MKRHRMIVTSAFALFALGGASAAHGGGDPVFADGYPRVWCWNAPMGDALSDARFARTVEANIYWSDCGDPACCDRSPEHIADLTCDAIEDRTLTAGHVGIRLGGLGLGNLPANAPVQFDCSGMGCGVGASDCRIPALMGHEDDDIVFTYNMVGYTYPTPWVWDGIDETTEWMDDYITQYEARQSGSMVGIPDPDRFLFDLEFPWLLEAAPGDSIGIAVAYWTALKGDPRWDGRGEEDVPGFGETLEEIWTNAGEPEVTVPMSWNYSYVGGSAANQEWFIWWRNLMMQVGANAMELAVDTPIHTEWPSCLISDYYASSKLDGGGTNNANSYVDTGYESSIGRRLWWEGSGDLQQPVLYPSSTAYLFDQYAVTDDSCTDLGWSPHEPVAEAALRVMRFNMDSCVFSFSGANKWAIMPALPLPHEYFPIFGPQIASIPYDVGVDNRVSNDADRRAIALAKSRGCQELFVWNTLPNDTPLSPQHDYNWTRFKELLDQVWGFDPESCSVYAGSGSTDQTKLAYAHGDSLTVTASTSTGAGVETVFTNDYGQTGFLRVNIELTSSVNSTVRAYVRKTNSTDATIDLDPVSGSTGVDVCAGERVRLTGRIATGANFYGTGDRVTIRVLVDPDSTAFTADFDLIQVMADDNERRLKADFNGDGVLDSDDDDAFYALYAIATGSPAVFIPAVDFNHDGVINGTDASDWDTCYGSGGACGRLNETFPHTP